jgi:hypothetical protein
MFRTSRRPLGFIALKLNGNLFRTDSDYHIAIDENGVVSRIQRSPLKRQAGVEECNICGASNDSDITYFSIWGTNYGVCSDDDCLKAATAARRDYMMATTIYRLARNTFWLGVSREIFFILTEFFPPELADMIAVLHDTHVKVPETMIPQIGQSSSE